jgi:hypothetical protein
MLCRAPRDVNFVRWFVPDSLALERALQAPRARGCTARLQPGMPALEGGAAKLHHNIS